MRPQRQHGPHAFHDVRDAAEVHGAALSTPRLQRLQHLHDQRIRSQGLGFHHLEQAEGRQALCANRVVLFAADARSEDGTLAKGKDLAVP